MLPDPIYTKHNPCFAAPSRPPPCRQRQQKIRRRPVRDVDQSIPVLRPRNMLNRTTSRREIPSRSFQIACNIGSECFATANECSDYPPYNRHRRLHIKPNRELLRRPSTTPFRVAVAR